MRFNQVSENVKLNNNIFNIYNLESNCEQVQSVGAI
jgi:hypothetical protein